MKKRIIALLLALTMVLSVAPLSGLAAETTEYSGNKVSILGDSISTYLNYIPSGYTARYPDANEDCDVQNVEATWWYQLITELGATLEVNNSGAGTTVGTARSHAMASMTRIRNLGNPNVILFFGGTNDLNEINAGSLELGSFDADNAPTEIDDSVESWNTFADAYTAAIVRLKAAYPNARIIAILPMATDNYYSADTLASGKSIMQAICSHYSVQYVDIGSVELYDGIHPTAAGMDAITAAVYTAITGNQMEEQEPADTTKGEVESRLRQISLLTYNDTNLWSNPEAGYYDGTKWLDSYGTVCSITIAVEPGYHVYATSFQSAPANGGTRAGIRVTYFNGEEVINSVGPDAVYTELNQNGYLTVPEGVTAMNIPMWKDATENVVYITNIQNDHLQKIPADAYNDTNLWDILNHDNGYYNGTSWGPATVQGKVVKSVTIPVVPGDKIYASSFQAKADNGNVRDGIRVTYYKGNTVVQSIGPDIVYPDWKADGYLEVPEGVNAVEIPVWEENGAVVNVLTLPARPVSGDAVAQIGTQEYTSLAAAVADAGDNAEIKLLADVSGAGIVIDKSITIDFNEHTYTVTYPTVGSVGTETNGFQILSGNTVTLKNGTLAAGLHNGEKKVKILVQNYADLTVTDMVLDGTNGCVNDNEFFTLSCNNGNVSVNGNTSIIAPAGHYALDSYNLMSPETYKNVSVTLNTTGTITGDIRAAGNNASLSLEKAVVNGEVVIRKGADVVVGLTNGNNEDVKITGEYAIAVFGQGDGLDATTLTVNGGTITGTTAYAISGNGSITDTYSYSNTKITINGGVITSNGTGFGGAAVYHPQGGILTINGGTITGLTGVEIRGGELQINGGTITATGEYAERLNTENGATTQGVAVAVNKYDHQNSSAVAITGGVINATSETGKVLFVNEEMGGYIAVSGGTYNQAVPAEYCAENFTSIENSDGTYGVEGKIAEIDGVYYSSLAAAVAAAEEGAEIKLLADATGEGIVIDKSVTIDFGGKTYTVTYPTVGSTGTETNGFQILSGNTVTLKNGTLAAGLYNGEKKVKILVQNYADLTVTDMVLDGTNGYTGGTDYYFYTLSNNNGEININGATDIIAPAGHFALDVYNLMSPETYKEVNVTLNTTGTITGPIRVIGNEAAIDIQKAKINDNTNDTALYVMSGATATVGTVGGSNSDVQISSSGYGIFVRGQGSTNQVTTLTVNSGTITSENGYTISGNGSITASYDYSNTAVTINGGVITCNADGYGAAIYNPQGGTLSINGGEITGQTGVEVRAGTVSITGGTITATGAYAERLDYHNGATMQGVAVAVNKYDHQTGSDVSIAGGTIQATGENSKILKLNAEGTNGGTLAVSGGTYNQAVPAEYCADGFEPKANGDGTYSVKEEGTTEIKVKYNLTLESYMDFSFFVPKSAVTGENLVVTVTLNGVEREIDTWTEQTSEGVVYLRIRYADVAPAQYQDTLTLTIKDASGNIIVSDSTTMESYINLRISRNEDDKALMEALLAYCSAAKAYFG